LRPAAQLMNDERPMNQTDELMADDELTELRSKNVG
jgi:hypothetical protein